MSKSTTYKDAGVDIEKAENALKRVKKRIVNTYTPEVLSGVGLFGSFYDLSEHSLQEPVLVASTDGVGTKLKVAILSNRHNTIGQDLVNHCINDIATCGAKPIFFLDYIASGNLEPGVYADVVSGMALACKNAGIPLIGGETAELADFYAPGDYDISGTIIGLVEKSKIIDGSTIKPGDILIGVESNGLHTNGYTLARRVLLNQFSLDDEIEEFEKTLADELLRIHSNYYPLISEVTGQFQVKGISHITGGGIVKNTQRLFAQKQSSQKTEFDLKVDWGSWPVPPIFDLIQKHGDVPIDDMRQTFNMGIGLILIVDPQTAPQLLEFGEQFSHRFYRIGSVEQD